MSSVHPEPKVVPTTDEALATFEQLADESHHHVVAQKLGHALWGRTEEKAKQIALILACSFDRAEPKIDGKAARLACTLARAVTRHMVSIAQDWLASNQQEGISKRLLRIIKDVPDGLTKSQLTRKSQWLKKRDRDDLLVSLIESELVMAVQVPYGNGTKLVFKATRP